MSVEIPSERCSLYEKWFISKKATFFYLRHFKLFIWIRGCFQIRNEPAQVPSPLTFVWCFSCCPSAETTWLPRPAARNGCPWEHFCSEWLFPWVRCESVTWSPPDRHQTRTLPSPSGPLWPSPWLEWRGDIRLPPVWAVARATAHYALRCGGVTRHLCVRFALIAEMWLVSLLI